MRNLDYDLLRSTSPLNSHRASPTLIPTSDTAATMSNGAPRNSSSPSSPTLSHANSHTFTFPNVSTDSITSTSSSTSKNPTSNITPSASQNLARHPSRASSVSSVSSVGPSKIIPKITPAPTTQKQKHYWVPYTPEMNSNPSGSSSGPSSSQVDDIVSRATGENFHGLNNDLAPAAPPPPPQVRYTRTGQIIPEGKVMMVNGGCVGEADWKRTNGAIQSMFEPLHHVLTANGTVPHPLPQNGFWLRAMTDESVVELCRAYGIEVDPDGDPRKTRAAFLNYLGATYLAAVV